MIAATTLSDCIRVPSMASPKSPARWPALVGGGLLNVALGTYYAWSVFVPALEREFGWTRTQTSLVATIDMVMLASMFMVAGLIQLHFVAHGTVSDVGRDGGRRTRIRLPRADHRRIEMVSGSARTRERTRDRHLRRGLGHLRTARRQSRRAVRLARRLSDARRTVLCFHDGRRVSAERSAGVVSPAGAALLRQPQEVAPERRHPHVEGPADADVLRTVDCVRAGHDRRHDGD